MNSFLQPSERPKWLYLHIYLFIRKKKNKGITMATQSKNGISIEKHHFNAIEDSVL